MAGLAEKILERLQTCDKLHTLDLVQIFNEDHQKIIGAVKSLQALENNAIEVEQLSSKKWELTEEGTYVVENGSHEAAVYNSVPEKGIAQSELIKSSPYAKVGFSKAIMLGWIELDKSSGAPVVRRRVPNITDTTRAQLKDLSNITDKNKMEFKKRKLLQETVIKSLMIRKGPNFSTKIEKLEADLTADLLINDNWKQKTFKPYNFDALGQALDSGHLHPLMKVRSEFRKIFIEMGFQEMPTNNFVESSFWNFDALFVPQQHPARDDHDTFFISEPCLTKTLPQEYMEKVKQVHSAGGYGSQGYRYDWKIEEASKNVLRTHTTAVSARMLHKLMQQGEFKPVKFFSIDRVFRNETLDATHLAEFHQVEGVVADYNLTLGNLIGILYEFFSKLGITQLQFKPAYNPYTEPSMEIFCFHNGLGKWIEIGNSGVFRPEMLLPMGLPENVNVIAWGLSLERPTMIKYGLNNIRDLVGPKVDLQMVHNNPLCRLEKHSSNRVEVDKSANDVAQQLERIKREAPRNVNAQPVKLVIMCDPSDSVTAFESIFRFLQKNFSLNVSTHVHSSVRNSNLKNLFASYRSKVATEFDVTFIFITRPFGPCVKISKTEIVGMVNIARYINREIERRRPGVLPYECLGPDYANKIDALLDDISASMKNNCLPRNVGGKFAMGVISMVDIICSNLG